MRRMLISIAAICLMVASSHAEPGVDEILVVKSERALHLLAEGKPVRSYGIALGAQPSGHKRQEGDERTPEGRYVLDWRNHASAFHKSIHISYPNAADREAAASRGVDPGGMIMIHGQRNGLAWLSWITQRFDWTDGCIALSNADMEEIWDLVPNGTPIEIRR